MIRGVIWETFCGVKFLSLSLEFELQSSSKSSRFEVSIPGIPENPQGLGFLWIGNRNKIIEP
jgi:hypothetical protein